MTAGIGFIISAICIGHVGLTYYLMKEFGQIGTKSEMDDHYQIYKESDKYIEKGTKEEKLFIMKCIRKGIIHNFDFVSDLLYIIYVPTYNHTIKVLLVVSILQPPIVLLIGAACCGRTMNSVKKAITFFLGVVPLYEYIYCGVTRLV